MKSVFSVLLAILFLTLLGCRKDPCASVICKNDGYCENGECICPEGFEGSECGQPIPPKIMYVSRVKVRSWPETNNGISWDSASTADIYPCISNESGIIWKNYIRFPDADISHNYLFDVDPAISLDPDERYTISVWDYDRNDQDDHMGDAVFKLNRIRQGFPNSIEIEGVNVAFTLNVSYEF